MLGVIFQVFHIVQNLAIVAILLRLLILVFQELLMEFYYLHLLLVFVLIFRLLSLLSNRK